MVDTPPKNAGNAQGEEGPSTHQAGRSLLKASFWVAVTEGVVQLATFVSTIVAARVIAPAEFGLMGVVNLAMATLAAFSVSGFEDALVQKKADVEQMLDAVWTWNVLRGLGFVVLLSAASPLIAKLYDQPSLAPLMIVTSFGALLTGAQNIGQILYQRQLDFKKLFYINVGTILLRLALYLPAVLILRNVWALAIGSIAGGVATLIVTYVSHPYRPKFRLDFTELRKLTAFGKWMTGMSVMIFIITQGDDIFISRYIGIAALAFYQMAYGISNMPATHITHVLIKANFAPLARLQDHPEVSRQVIRGVMRGTMLLSGPLTVLIWALAPAYVAHVVGPTWEPIIPLIRILVISGFLRSFAGIAGLYFNAVGRPELNFRMQVPRFFTLVLLVWPLSALWGIEGACVAAALASAACLPVWFLGMREVGKLGIVETLRENVLCFVTSALLAGAFYGLRPLFSQGVVQTIGWILSSLLLWVASLWLLGKVSSLDVFEEIQKVRNTARGRA
jgi:O-antigen/teichoic acid export membrane protein